MESLESLDMMVHDAVYQDRDRVAGRPKANVKSGIATVA